MDNEIKKGVQLETDRLIVRRFLADDWIDLYEYLSKEEVVKFEPYHTFTLEECKQEAISRSENEAFWAVCLKDGNKLIGNLYFSQDGPSEFCTWEIGYVFNPKYYGKGYATEACKSMMQYAFNHGVHRIFGMCNPENTASWKLLERLGMRREGHFLKKAFFHKTEDGRPIWFNAYEYAVLEEEWGTSER